MKKIPTVLFLAAAAMGFCQCTQPASNTQQPEQAPVAASGFKIAYIDVDSLLSNYAFYQDLSEEMMRKEENYRLVLAEKAKKLEKEVDDFNKKFNNGVFSSQERVDSERNRLARKQQSLQEESDKYRKELAIESNANSQKISEAIDKYIKEYNKTHGYNMIVSKAATMYADENLNITAQILEGLNAAYKPIDE